MIVDTKLHSYFERFRSFYIIYFGTILILKEFGPYDFIPKILNTILVVPAGLIGIFFILYDLLQMIKSRKFTYNILLFLFLIIMGISSLLNYHYGLGSNIKILLNESIYLLVIYEFGHNRTQSRYIVDIFSKILIALWFVMVAMSNVMFVLQMQYSVKLPNRFHPLRIGFLENRLFGVFSDPNFAATICLVSIILSCMFLFQKQIKNRIIRIFLYINSLFCLSFILLSGSRTGLVETLAVVFIVGFTLMNQYLVKKEKSMSFSIIMSLILSTIVTGVVFLILSVVKQGLTLIPDFVESLKTETIKNKIRIDNKEKSVNLTRNDVSDSDDLSNGRFGIWKAGFLMFKQNVLFGVGPSREGIVSYAKAFLPETYVAKTGLSLHSFVIHTLAGTGAIGFITFFSFYINKAFTAIKAVFLDKTLYKTVYFYDILIIAAISINAVLSSEIILVNKIGAFIFWLLLGQLVHQYFPKKNSEHRFS